MITRAAQKLAGMKAGDACGSRTGDRCGVRRGGRRDRGRQSLPGPSGAACSWLRSRQANRLFSARRESTTAAQ